MEWIVVALLVAVIFLLWRLYASHRKITDLRLRLTAASPYIRRAGPLAQLDFLLNASDWDLIQSGGNNQAGKIGGLGLCPCQKEYTINVRQTFFQQRPNAQQLQNCLNNPPPTAAPGWSCPEDCVQVMTHRWNGFDVFQNNKTGQFLLNCNQFAQYHCKKPNDPARDAPPVEGPPGPDIED